MLFSRKCEANYIYNLLRTFSKITFPSVSIFFIPVKSELKLCVTRLDLKYHHDNMSV